MTSFAPIILFVYNRPRHTRQTIEALKKNNFAGQSDLIIYADGAKNSDTSESVRKVRDYIKTVNGFNNVVLYERNENWGLAANIIGGVSDAVNKYGRVIVLEDDIVTSPSFLKYMNQALVFYEKEKKVWHISGWNYPIDTVGLSDGFFWRVMNCWGWATWADRWQHFQKNPEALIEQWSPEYKYRFDLNGSGIFWSQVEANAQGKINTWAIFWYATIFQNDGLCLNPVTSFVDNIGQDGSGVNCGNSNDNKSNKSIVWEKDQFDWPIEIKESVMAVEKIKAYYKKLRKPFFVRVINKLVRLIYWKNIIH